jgi:hypothetical protein
MPNGGVGAYEYFDETYNGNGNPGVIYDPLSDGTGQLTDGVASSQHWDAACAAATPANPCPWVAWLHPTSDFAGTIYPGLTGPVVITFFFDQVYDITSMEIHVDDTDYTFGAVEAPYSASLFDGINTISGNLTNPPANNSPIWISLPTGGLRGDFLTLTLNLRPNATSSEPHWIFLDEVRIEGTPVPEPATVGMTVAGLAIVAAGILRNRRPGV